MVPEVQYSSGSSHNDKEPTALNSAAFDVEQQAVAEAHLRNTTIKSIAWKGVKVTVKDRKTKLPKSIVDDVEGVVEAGELFAIMGPSGCGKTTLLNFLASRPTGPSSSTSGKILVNGNPMDSRSLTLFHRTTSRFVEQEDTMIGSLTVRETLHFASRLATASSSSERISRVEGLLDAFGLREQANTLVGTPLRKGISGGQKRRLGVASQLITGPKVLFLDEPTSGLDSVAGWEVVKYLRGVTKRNNLIVIASIHQPSTATFNLFDKLLLMSHGKMHYFGPVAAVTSHYKSLGHQVPVHVNPAEFLLELVNTDFTTDKDTASRQLEDMHLAWMNSVKSTELRVLLDSIEKAGSNAVIDLGTPEKKPTHIRLVLTLLHRSFLKSYRDVVVYGIRLMMYMGLAIMMGTVWLRLDTSQESIIPIINALFYGSAFLSFMACAYSPAYIEDYMQYIKEKRNGLYGATSMIVSNFLIGTPYLFVFALVFSSISYWLSNFQPTAKAFFVSTLWVFLDLLGAESLVVLMSSLFPSFVISLALIAFANGLWMSVGGFMVPPTILNVFYKYVFHYWDYQKYAFENMLINEFSERVYVCQKTATDCQCMWQTDLADQCLVRGQGVLDGYGYKPGHMGRDVGIMMGIVFGYRLAAWIVLKLKN